MLSDSYSYFSIVACAEVARYVAKCTTDVLLAQETTKQNQHMLAHEATLLPHERKRIVENREMAYYATQLNKWSDWRCSKFTHRTWRQELESELLAKVGATKPDKALELQTAFRESTCGNHQYLAIQQFLINFKK